MRWRRVSAWIEKSPVHATIGSLVFVALGLALTITPDSFVHPGRRSALLIRLVGIACVTFFGLCAVMWSRRALQDRLRS